MSVPETRAENLPVSKLCRCPIQLRSVRKETLQYVVLRDSIRDRGLLTPLLVRPVTSPVGTVIYEVVDGSHRFEAILDLRLEVVPCNVKEMTNAEVLEMQIEAHGNIPTTRMDYARRLWRIINVDKSLSVQEVAYGIHRTVDWVRKTMNLIRLSPSSQSALDGGRLPLNCAYEFAKVPSPWQDQLLELLGSISNKELRHMAQDKARQFNEGKKDARIERAMIDKSQLRGQIRNMKEVEHELEQPTVAASILCEENAETLLDAWKACCKWVLRRDKASLAYLREKLYRESLESGE